MHMSKSRGRAGRSSERGQALILFVGLFTIIAIAAAIVIDFGIWFSERRGAQKDADLVTLAGAYELLSDDVTFGDVDGATQQWAAANGLDPANNLHNLAVKSLAFPDGYSDDPEYCHNAVSTDERPNAVVLDVSHESRALFAAIFGVDAPDIGAHACARAGSLHGTTGLRPWTVSALNSDCFEDGVPFFGQDCLFRLESPSSQVGSIRLGDDPGEDCDDGAGAATYRENVEEGADAYCAIGDFINTEPGLNTGPTLTALANLLSTEGECDDLNGDGDGIDQFAEAYSPTLGVPGPDETFVARDCETPRAVHIVIIDEWDGTGFDTRPIMGFAAFYILGCEELDNSGVVVEVYETCDVQGGGQGSFQIRGFFMNILELEGDIGTFDPFGTHVIRLVE